MVVAPSHVAKSSDSARNGAGGAELRNASSDLLMSSFKNPAIKLQMALATV
jgi:hypothetical protein